MYKVIDQHPNWGSVMYFGSGCENIKAQRWLARPASPFPGAQLGQRRSSARYSKASMSRRLHAACSASNNVVSSLGALELFTRRDTGQARNKSAGAGSRTSLANHPFHSATSLNLPSDLCQCRHRVPPARRSRTSRACRPPVRGEPRTDHAGDLRAAGARASAQPRRLRGAYP